MSAEWDGHIFVSARHAPADAAWDLGCCSDTLLTHLACCPPGSQDPFRVFSLKLWGKKSRLQLQSIEVRIQSWDEERYYSYM